MVTNKEVLDAEQEFSSLVSGAIETFLWDHMAIFEYKKGDPVL